MSKAFSIIPENRRGPSEETLVANFETIGRRIDLELERLRIFVDKELKPTTQRKTAAALRKTSRKLAQLAAEIEAHLAEKK